MNKALQKTGKIVTYLILIVISLFFFFPLLWTFGTSMKPPSEYYSTPPTILPRDPTIVHYIEAFIPWQLERMEETRRYWVEEAAGRAHPITPSIKNSLIVTFLSVILSLLIGIPSSYALSRYKFRGSDNIAFWILSVRMLPPIVAAIPIFLIVNSLGLVDTYPGLIIPYIMLNLPFVVWMMKGFISDIPIEIEEAAQIDGCSRFSSFLRVTLPLCIGGIVATALFCVFITWNEFLFAVILTRTNVQTLTVNLSTFRLDRGILWGMMSATITVAVLPLLFLTFFFQKQLVKGLTAGAIK
jgi:multiple sugar transport system permease protein